MSGSGGTTGAFKMANFSKTHTALFDELQRQGVMNVDIGRLTRAVLSATNIIATQDNDRFRSQPPSRCVNGFCDE
jgi:hypothetical protein